MSKICSKCKIKQDKSEFIKDKNRKDGLYPQCKKCRKQSYKDNEEKYKEKQKIYKEEHKEYYKEYNKEYNKIHKEKLKERSKEYYKENKESVKKNVKKYYEENKDKINIYKKEWVKNKRKDPSCKLRSNISRIINAALKNNNSNKRGISCFKNINYSPKELKQHLESQFESWMTWDNYGKANNNKRTWHIDHIIPQSSLIYTSMSEENFRKCWALENLRPLEAIENLKKGNKILGKDKK
jgi:hypothetical protein